MSKKAVAALISSILGIGIVIVFSVIHSGDPYGIIGVAMAMAVEIFIMLCAGLILLSSPESKPIGQGILLGMLITGVIGFGICSSVG